MSEDILAKYRGDFNRNIGIWDLFSLKDRVAIVTGGAGIYGSVISTALAEAGATVVIASRGVEKCEARAAKLRERGLDAVGMKLDMTSDESILALRDTVVEKFGQIDIVFNNAAGRAVGTAEEQIKAGFKGANKTAMDQMTREMWDGAMAVNSSGFFKCCQVFAEDMRARDVKGAIVNISSIYGNVGPDFSIYPPGMTSPPDYSYSKAGIINFTRYMATFYGRFGIRVNCISPGGYYSNQPLEFLERYEARTPLGRMAGWNDLKGAAVFLASDAARYITGHNLLVDGGWTAW